MNDTKYISHYTYRQPVIQFVESYDPIKRVLRIIPNYCDPMSLYSFNKHEITRF